MSSSTALSLVLLVLLSWSGEQEENRQKPSTVAEHAQWPTSSGTSEGSCILIYLDCFDGSGDEMNEVGMVNERRSGFDDVRITC